MQGSAHSFVMIPSIVKFIYHLVGPDVKELIKTEDFIMMIIMITCSNGKQQLLDEFELEVK